MRKILACGLGGWLLLGAAPSARCEGGEDVAFVAAGLGPGSQGLAGVVSVNFRQGRRFYVVRMSRTEEFSIFGPSPTQSDTDLGFLVGKASAGRLSVSSAALGLALVHSVRRGAEVEPPGWLSGGSYERREHFTIGLPVDLKTTLNFARAGVGVNLFANLNTRGSFGGMALTVQLGRMR